MRILSGAWIKIIFPLRNGWSMLSGHERWGCAWRWLYCFRQGILDHCQPCGLYSFPQFFSCWYNAEIVVNKQFWLFIYIYDSSTWRTFIFWSVGCFSWNSSSSSKPLKQKRMIADYNYLKSSRIFTKSSKLLNNDMEVILSFNSFH